MEMRYTRGEEIASALIHGAGTVLSVAGLVMLITRAVNYVPVEYHLSFLVGFITFGSSLIILYLASTLYHALTNPAAKKIFGIFDHSSIYLLIAGTYTPFCLTTLHGALGWTMLGVIWCLAVTGIACYSIFGSRIRTISAVTYIPMGLIIVFAAGPMKANLFSVSGNNISWDLLVAGGASYIAGTAFYAMKKKKWTHSIWHLFVIAGSIMHYFSVYFSA